MRSIVWFTTFASALAAVGLVRADEKPAIRVAQKSADKPTVKNATPKVAATDNRDSDEAAIRRSAETYMKAYAEANAKAAAAHFTADAEYVDENGNVTQGRPALEQQLATHFADASGEKLQLKIESIRFVGPGTAIEDGIATQTPGGAGDAVRNSYTAVHVKTEGKWLVASVRDFTSHVQPSRREQLKQLEWLVGEWLDEGGSSTISFSCQPIDGGIFLLREFTIRIDGRNAMSGSQRIGWDAVAGSFRAWTFDSEGGFGDGVWHRDGESWVLKSNGQSGDGKVASATSVFTVVNPHTITWQNVEHIVNGEQLPASKLVKLVRKPPQPKLSTK